MLLGLFVWAGLLLFLLLPLAGGVPDLDLLSAPTCNSRRRGSPGSGTSATWTTRSWIDATMALALHRRRVVHRASPWGSAGRSTFFLVRSRFFGRVLVLDRLAAGTHHRADDHPVHRAVRRLRASSS
jgi:hypothetical protein